MFNIVVIPGMPVNKIAVAPATKTISVSGFPAMKTITLPNPFKVGDLVTRDGTDLQRVTYVGYAGDLIDVECVHDPVGYLLEYGISRGEPWCRVGETESNMARRYSLIQAADALEPDRTLAWLDIVVPDLLASDRVDAMTKLRLAARWAEAKS